MMTSERAQGPMAWEHRLVHLREIQGWSVEIWNPMAQVWERSPSMPHWPEAYEKEARLWVELANQEQALRNEESQATLRF